MPFLADLGTLLWLIGVVVLFILLANWSAGGNWSIASGVVDGVRGWARGIEQLTAPGPDGDAPKSVTEELGTRSIDR